MVSIKFFISKGFCIKPSASHTENASPCSACAENKIIGRFVCICLSSLHTSVPNLPGKRISNKIRLGGGALQYPARLNLLNEFVHQSHARLKCA